MVKTLEEFQTVLETKFPSTIWRAYIDTSEHGDRFYGQLFDWTVTYGNRPWGYTWEVFTLGGGTYSGVTLDEAYEEYLEYYPEYPAPKKVLV